MNLYKNIPALLVSYFASAFAQQSCYWPDGSGIRGGQGVWVNCHPSQDSTCCRQGEICLSNGLCYGSYIGEAYRGACTVKDWSNTTACPTQWCNDVIAASGSWSNIWKCPPVNNAPVQWWCGNESLTTACQTSIEGEASFVSYTTGSILGFPPVTSSPSAPSAAPSNLAATTSSAGPLSKEKSVVASSPANVSTGSAVSTSVPSSSPANKPTDLAASAQTKERSATLPTALGVGIGVPLGIATVGLLSFLFWKEIARQRRSEPQPRSSQDIVLNHGAHFGTTNIRGLSNELNGTQPPREMDGRAKFELPNM